MLNIDYIRDSVCIASHEEGLILDFCARESDVEISLVRGLERCDTQYCHSGWWERGEHCHLKSYG